MIKLYTEIAGPKALKNFFLMLLALIVA